MSRRKPAIFWVLLALAVAVAIWWVLYVPYSEERLFGAIPANARLVTVLDRPAQRLDSLLQSPLFSGLLLSAGVREEDLQSLATDPDTRQWVRRLASHKVVLAQVPGLGTNAEPVWVGASWLGSSGHRLRWWLQAIGNKSFVSAHVEGATAVWVVRTRLSDPHLHLSVAISDGLLLACISRDPIGVRYVLETHERYPWRPSVVSWKRLKTARGLWHTQYPDRGWYLWPEAWRQPAFAPTLLAFEVNFPTAGGLAAEITADHDFPSGPAPAADQSLNRLDRLIGSTPDLFITAPSSAVDLVLPESPSNPWITAARQVLVDPQRPDARVALCLLSREYVARIRGPLGSGLASLVKGLKVPSLLVAVERAAGASAEPRIRSALDTLNGARHFGLVPHPVQFDGGGLTMIDETQKNLYAQFEPEERISYAEADGWLLLCSNMSILRRLLTEHGAAAAQAEAGARATWALSGQPDAGTAVYACGNLRGAARTVSDAISATLLVLLMRDAEGTQATRRQLAEVKGWIEPLRTLDQGWGSITPTGNVTHLALTLTAPPPETTVTHAAPQPPAR